MAGGTLMFWALGRGPAGLTDVDGSGSGVGVLGCSVGVEPWARG